MFSDISISVPQNEPVGYYVTRVVATDEDEGQNGVVNYALVESAVIQDWQKFSIHPTEGNVTTAHVINREEQMTYYVSHGIIPPSYNYPIYIHFEQIPPQSEYKCPDFV